MVSDLKTETPGALPPGKIRGTITALQLMLLLAAIDQTIISTAMPKIVTALGGFDRYAWATTSYLFASTIAIPIIGRLSDVYGRRRLLSLGVLIFIASSVLCGMAGMIQLSLDAMNQFVIARILQGVGGGIILGLCFTVVGDLFSPAERGKYQGHFAAVFALASVVGPTLGGWITDCFSWRWLFFANVPLGAFSLLVFLTSFADREKGRRAYSLDYKGISLLTVAVMSYLTLLTEASNIGWSQPETLVLLAIAALSSLGFLAVEFGASDPFMPLSFFKISTVSISCFSVFTTGIGMFGSTMLLPIFFESVLGFSARNSGTLLTPLIVIVASTSIIGGAWMSRSKKYKLIVLIALALMSVGTLLLAGVKPETGLPITVADMVLVGAGLGLILPVYTVVIQNAVSQKDMGAVTGFSQFFRSIGGTSGVAVFGSLMLALYRHNLARLLGAGAPLAAASILSNPLDPNKARLALAHAGINAQLGDQMLRASALALAQAIDKIFLSYGILLLLVFVINLWLVELPLRETSDHDAS